MKLDDLLAVLEKGEFDTPATPLNPTGVSAKAASDGTYTPAPLFPAKKQYAGGGEKTRWRHIWNDVPLVAVSLFQSGAEGSVLLAAVNEAEALEGEPDGNIGRTI